MTKEYHITKVKTTFFKFFRKIGDVGDEIVYSARKTFYKPINSEKMEIALRKISKAGKKIVFNLKENKKNWGHRIDFGNNFLINHDDV
jgi:hypothetical protein